MMNTQNVQKTQKTQDTQNPQTLLSGDEFINRINTLYQEMLRCSAPDAAEKIARQIISLQSEDGAWAAIETRCADSDAIVFFIYFPTYHATAALMKYAVLKENLPKAIANAALKENLPADIANALHEGLKFAQRRKLCGAGYDATADLLHAISIYKQAGLYDWMKIFKDREPDFCDMIKDIIERFRTNVATGRTLSDWSRDFSKEFEQEIAEYDENMFDYVWYAAYGSNLCYSRFMEYVNKCSDTGAPEDSKPYLIPYELYFAYSSRRWNRGGVAFIDPDKPGKTPARVYKIRREQFHEIQILEGEPYRNKVMLSMLDGIPVYTVTSPMRRSDIQAPGKAYLDVMLAGLKETYPDKHELVHMVYLVSHINMNEDDRKVLSFIREASHGQKISEITMCGIAITRVKKSVRILCNLGLIRQDSRSISRGNDANSADAVYYTCKEKRDLIDIMLLSGSISG